jgi:hypothetical protein
MTASLARMTPTIPPTSGPSRSHGSSFASCAASGVVVDSLASAATSLRAATSASRETPRSLSYASVIGRPSRRASSNTRWSPGARLAPSIEAGAKFLPRSTCSMPYAGSLGVRNRSEPEPSPTTPRMSNPTGLSARARRRSAMAVTTRFVPFRLTSERFEHGGRKAASNGPRPFLRVRGLEPDGQELAARRRPHTRRRPRHPPVQSQQHGPLMLLFEILSRRSRYLEFSRVGKSHGETSGSRMARLPEAQSRDFRKSHHETSESSFESRPDPGSRFGYQ